MSNFKPSLLLNAGRRWCSIRQSWSRLSRSAGLQKAQKVKC